ncbi:hypothetical protein CVT26_008283 [Gymnopilus dilepis]|uniref:Uncharacterized protein n=1 Tax=Gymnopilus dilepis TaxID=231916 RepID=A0A409WCL6_9AGAR|nr:hypothetical protein CVT26_008283 [Gymnopilus dilepis]
MPQGADSYDEVDGMKTPAERARENFLLNDPLALVLGPSYVECRQCNKKIKLSSKSAFDTFHWRNHRARCVKATKKKAKAASPVLNFRRPPSTPYRPPRSPIPRPTRRDSGTPPSLDISDSEEEHRSELSAEPQSPPYAMSSSPLSIQSPLETRQSDATLDDYMLRFHPDCFHKTRSSTDHWQTWSWSRLKQPHFPAPAYAYHENEVRDDDDDDDCGLERLASLPNMDSRARDAAHALSLLSRSH